MGKPTPAFWWDFVENATAVIVESDYPGGAELARFEVPDSGGAEQQIHAAEQLIADYLAGRKTPAWCNPAKPKGKNHEQSGPAVSQRGRRHE